MAAQMHNHHKWHYLHPNASIGEELRAPNTSPTPHTGNDSIDVALMGCFDHYDTLACTRNSLMAVLVILTGLLCVIKVCRLHFSKQPSHPQYILFYAATIECTLCSVHWILGKYTQLEFIIHWLKLVQLLVVSHLYWTIVSRVHRKANVTNRVVVPLYILSLLYFTVVAILGCIFTQESWVECFQPYWIALSSVELFMVQLFLVAAIQIAKRLNEISTLDSVRREQKRDLCMLVVFFECSAICGFAYDLTLRILFDDDGGCSGIFLHTEQIYTPLYGTFMVVKFLLPIWAMLFVFHPIEGSSENQDLLIPSDEGRYSSIFRPTYRRSHYRPINYAAGDFNAIPPELEHSPPSGPSSAGTTPVFGPRQQNVRRISEIQSSIEQDQSVDVSDTRPML